MLTGERAQQHELNDFGLIAKVLRQGTTNLLQSQEGGKAARRRAGIERAIDHALL